MNGRLLLNVRIVVPTLLGRRLNSTLPQFSTINVTEARKHVYQVELNRPKTRNSLNFEVWKELKVAFDHLDKFPSCRAIILSGKGPSFCAGIDLKEGIASLLNITGNSDTDVSRKAYYLNQAHIGSTRRIQRD
ncbi:hypothetical protein M3Y97_00574800 [Aphelenchoides bicaudatus]|nr:hypothetical protein M3Y97_00574800 [Aphelenchoides bicaudatus]